MSSVGETHRLIRTYEAVPESVPRARHAITAFAADAGANVNELDDIRLASSEALTNVVVHAYGDGAGRVHVSAALAEDELWVLVGDDGNGLHAGTSRGGLGMGLALIAELCDSLAVVNRSTGGTEVRMRFTIAGARRRRSDNGGQSVRSSMASAARPAASFFSTTK
jgi:anti-sigma regulatory factor (Ser/Thr protein kinase)